MTEKVGGMMSGIAAGMRGAAADALEKGGAISPALARELRADTVSAIDVEAAKGIAQRLKGTPLAEAANVLSTTLKAKLDSQGLLASAGNLALDLVGSASGAEVHRQVIRNIK